MPSAGLKGEEEEERHQQQQTISDRVSRKIVPYSNPSNSNARANFNQYLRDRYQAHMNLIRTPLIVELPNDHPDESEIVNYRVSEPRNQKVIALRYENDKPSTSKSQSNGKPKRRVRSFANLMNETETYCCQTCFKHFTRKWNHERHEKACIAKPIYFRCSICNKKYQKTSYLAAHIKSHNTNKDRTADYKDLLALTDVERDVEKSQKSVDSMAIPHNFRVIM